MQWFASWRNRHLPLLFLLFCRHRRHLSFPHDVPDWTKRCNDRFGPEAAKPTAPMPTRTLFSLVREGITNCLVCYPTYSYVEHNPQQEQKGHWRVMVGVRWKKRDFFKYPPDTSECSKLPIWYPESFVPKNWVERVRLGVSNIEYSALTKSSILHAVLSPFFRSQRHVSHFKDVKLLLYMFDWNEGAKYQGQILTSSGSSGYYQG